MEEEDGCPCPRQTVLAFNRYRPTKSNVERPLLASSSRRSRGLLAPSVSDWASAGVVMDLNTVLLRLMKEFGCLPAIKLAWSCQLNLQDPNEIPKLSPSHYFRELQYTSEERQALLTEQHRVIKVSSYGFKVSVEPTILVFQNYKGGEKYSTVLNVRNIDAGMKKISFRMSETGPFVIDENSRRVGKFASGLVTSVVINFKPEDEEDYYHKLIVDVNGTRIAIPVIGFGARGILDFPDKVNFGAVPVNHDNRRLFPVLNIGSKPARFIVSAKAPFDVSPEKGVVLPNDSINLTLSFNSKVLGRYTGLLRVKYDTGEEVYVELEAEAINEDITFTPMDVEFQDTFIGMVRKGRVTIRNNSQIKTRFQWKGHVSSTSFLQENRDSLASQHKIHLAGSGPHPESHSHDSDKKRLYSRGDSLGINKILQSQKVHGAPHSEKQEPLYTDESFRIEPPMGEIQPRGSMELLIFFSPLRSGMFFSEAFCEIDGLEARAEMRLIGRGLGAKFKFGFDALDIGCVSIGGGHTYEIPVTNVSEIEGTISFDGFVGLMQGFQLKPDRITLSPGEFSAFFLFYNPILKPDSIYEELRFKVLGTDEVMSIVIKGKASYPELKFGEDVVNFDQVSYGFPETRQVVLISDSTIPLEIAVSIEPDGKEQVLTAPAIIAALKDPNFIFPGTPQEFQVEPSRFLISPHGFQRLTVTMTAALYGNYVKRLNARIGASTEIVKDVPIKGACVVPLILKPEAPIEINCVAGFPCPGSFTIHNPSALPAVFCCIPVKNENVLLSSEEFVGIAKARESTTIQFTATTKAKGVVDAIIEFYIAGKVDPLLDLVVTCKTISPVGALTLDKKYISMGQRKLHQLASETFNIINSSCVPIPYSITMATSGEAMEGTWNITPDCGTASPDFAENPVEVSVVLNEIGVYSGVLRVRVPGMKETLELQVKVIGVGCSVIFSPELDESGVVDFGYIFTHTPTTISFKITNPGFLTKHLEWRFEDDEPPVNPNIYANKKHKKTELDKMTPKKPPKPKPNTRKDSVFEIMPVKKVLEAGESFTLDIKAHSTSPQKAEKGFTLWVYADLEHHDMEIQRRISKAVIVRQHYSSPAKLGKTPSTEIDAMDQVYLPTAVQTIRVVAEFAQPKLKFSQHDISFKIDSSPTDYSKIYQQNVTITLENPCNLSLAVIMHTASPFCILMDEEPVEEWKHTFYPKEKLRLTVAFLVNRQIQEAGVMPFSGTLDFIYEIHPASDESIQLTAELHFPRVVLEREDIDFGEVSNGQEAIEEFNVKNPGKFCISYKAYIVAGSVSMEIVNPQGAGPDPMQELDLFYTSSDTGMYQQQQQALQLGGKTEHLSEGNEGAMCSESQESFSEFLKTFPQERRECDARQDKLRFFYEKFYRMKLMSALGLQDPDQEPNDELTYFHYFLEKPVGVNGILAAPNEVIDIIPENGVVQAGCSQKITLVFYAQSNLHFEAKVCFSVENGVSTFIQVKGRSVPPPDPYAILATPKVKCADLLKFNRR